MREMQIDPRVVALAAVKDARARRERAQRDELDEIEYALSIGISHAEIGRALGISRQAVRQYVERGRKS